MSRLRRALKPSPKSTKQTTCFLKVIHLIGEGQRDEPRFLIALVIRVEGEASYPWFSSDSLRFWCRRPQVCVLARCFFWKGGVRSVHPYPTSAIFRHHIVLKMNEVPSGSLRRAKARRGVRLKVEGLRQVAGCTRVAQAVTEHDKAPKLPKSKASNRTIPLDPATAKRLSEWKGQQKVELQDIGLEQVDGTPVVSNGVGEYMIPSNLSRWFRGFVAQNNFERCGLHKLRHTFGTLLVASGIDLVTVAHLMGHSGTAMVSKVYAHVVPDNVVQATKALGGVLYGNAGTTAVVLPFASLGLSV